MMKKKKKNNNNEIWDILYYVCATLLTLFMFPYYAIVSFIKDISIAHQTKEMADYLIKVFYNWD